MNVAVHDTGADAKDAAREYSMALVDTLPCALCNSRDVLFDLKSILAKRLWTGVFS
jgi:hypothetical protein